MATKKKPAAKVTAAAKPKKMTKANKVDWLERRTTDLVKQRQAFRDAAADFEEAHAASALAKKTMDNEQAKLNAIVNDIADIKTGNFTPPLPFPEERAAITTSATQTAEDVGGKKPLTTLIAKNLKAACPKHYRDGIGLSEKQVETLEKVIDGDKTVAGLEKFQKSNPIWNRSIKGFGEDAITKLQDAHEVLRRAFPIPSPDDKPATNGKPVDPMSQAFTAGQEACRAGKDLKSCGYPSGTPLALKWIEGHESEKSAKSAAADKPALSDADKAELKAAQDKSATKA